MKQLQNNYTNPERLKHCTTPEQSKRLLDLGLPAKSADCYYDSWKQVQWRQLADLYNDFFQRHSYYTPCWSVGRLIEIYFICSFQPEIFIDNTIENLVDYLLELFEGVAMNFSKLEE